MSPEVAQDNFHGCSSPWAASLFLGLPSHQGEPLLLHFAFTTHNKDGDGKCEDRNESQRKCIEVL